MSGTSLDGVDAVLVSWPTPGASNWQEGQLSELAFVHLDFPTPLRAELLALNHDGERELHRASMASHALAQVYAQAVHAAAKAAGCEPHEIRALGAHGQTLRHVPTLAPADRAWLQVASAASTAATRATAPGPDLAGYTIQLLNGARLAEACGVDVVCDFRSRDVAAGGQGAPLVPAFHAACFASPSEHRAVLNIGGIANLTVLPQGLAGATAGAPGGVPGAVRGWDTGPGNMLMDAWCQEQLGQPYDRDGAWARGGQVIEPLLNQFLAEPFLALPPPKSTGRDLFHREWLAGHLTACQPTKGRNRGLAQDIAATLAQFTARSIGDALLRNAPDTQRLLVCGGGAYNFDLMRRIEHCLNPGGVQAIAVQATTTAGIAPEKVEALAFAWLARAFVHGQAGNLPAVTGAKGPRPLGALYPGRVA